MTPARCATGLAAVVAVSTIVAATSPWDAQTSGVTARLRGVSAVSERVAWASGATGTILRTTDGGQSWSRTPVPGAESLDFRDVDAVSERVAYTLSIGPGEASRIYKTSDAGATWTLQFTNRDPKAFFDAMAFPDATHGVAVSDAVNGAFVVLTTSDGGAAWTRVPANALPAALPGEGAFAASGTNVAVHGTAHVWIGTTAGRVLRSADGGRSWDIAVTGLAISPTAGIFSVAFRDALHGVVVGGDYKQERAVSDNAAITPDGGRTWTLARGLGGFRSVVAYVPNATTPSLVAVGPAGADFSRDDGRTWQPIEGEGFHAFSIEPSGRTGWGVGETGRIGRLRPASLASSGPDGDHDAARARLFRDADRALALGPFSVMQKTRVAPSGNRHDFLTLAPYWWPDPARPDGLPYIRRDGEVNPESKRDTDDVPFVQMHEAAMTLTEAYRDTRDERFAARAAWLLRAWFIDPATRMNPHLDYGQAVPGRNTGRGAGIIATRRLVRIVDAARVLDTSSSWTRSDREALQAWCAAYATWLQTSAIGREEAKAPNNHGTWYAAQLSALLLYTGQRDTARRVLEDARRRLASQIEPDGRQPHELLRTRSWSYSVMNLEGWFTVARLADEAGVDVWTFRTADGRSLRAALDYLVPFASATATWPHPQITPAEWGDFAALLDQAARAWKSEDYRALAGRLRQRGQAGGQW